MGGILSFAVMALSGIAWAGPACPPADSLNHYVTTKFRAEKDGDAAGLIQIYYRLLKPYDPSRPTLLVINGGPGGDSSLVDAFEDTTLNKKYNIVGFDHRGLGCTKVLTREATAGPNEEGLFGMSRASDDIDAIRKDLLGENSKWFVYGVSYGSFLGQQYITKYPNSVSGAILDSAFDNYLANDIARKQYVSLFITSNPQVSKLFDQLVQLNPDLRSQFLAAIFSDTYNYTGRTQEIQIFYQDLLKLTSHDQVVERLNEVLGTPQPLLGMTRQIICEEIWDMSTAPEDQFFMHGITDQCEIYSGYRHPMNFDQALTKLPMRVFIFGGQYDPVTPIQAMRKMKQLIPRAVMWENPIAGHGVLFQNMMCGQDLIDRFMSGQTDDQLMTVAKRADCQSLPATLSSEEFYRKYISPKGFLF